MTIARRHGVFALPRLPHWPHPTRARAERVRPPMDPRDARRLRAAADGQRSVGIGHWPGLSDGEYMGRLLQRIH